MTELTELMIVGVVLFLVAPELVRIVALYFKG